MRAADAHKLPAGGALAVDRQGFSAAVTEALEQSSAHHHRARRSRRPCRPPTGVRSIIATGPLTSAAAGRQHRAGHGRRPSGLLRRHRAHRASRIRSISTSPGSSRAMTRRARAAAWPITSICRWTKPNIAAFVAALLAGEKTDFKEWEKSTPYFEACLPIEVMAARGLETLRFGPMKPVGLQRSAHRLSPSCGGAAAPGQCAGHAVEHGGLPDQAETWRAGAHLPHHSGTGECRNSRGWAACTATPSSIRRACWTRNCG